MIFIQLIITLFVVTFFYNQETDCAVLSIRLNVLNTNVTNGPENMGIGMGHSSLKGNWLKFVERLGVNSARLFVAPVTDLRNFIGTTPWGKNLNGVSVNNYNDFIKASVDLRSSNGRNWTYPWSNPAQWKNIYNGINTVSQSIYGSDENTINNLRSIRIKPLVVEHMGCGNADTTLVFQSMDPNSTIYWNERWEVYKHSYVMGVWARNKGVSMIEFYNEPDLSLGGCLDSDRFKDYYMVRSLAIQNAYSDCNKDDPLNQVDIRIVASAFARITYGGNLTRYLGDVSVQNRNYVFGSSVKNTSWSNMHIYSYHSYGKIGQDMYLDLLATQASINNDTSFPNEIPAIVTEHNAHTSSDWDLLTTTSDDPLEASRLGSQIMYLILGNITSQFVFKFSITPSFAANREVAKNGIHWGEIYIDPFHITDTTLCAESMRLLTKMKQSKLYPTTSNDTTKYRTYLGSKNDIENIYYLHMVNDKNDTVTVAIDLSAWNINSGAQMIVEVAGTDYWGEVSSILLAPNPGVLFNVVLSPFSTTRLSIPVSVQNSNKTYVNQTCTARAGTQSSISDCGKTTFFAGTSSTSTHENTSVSLLKFPVNPLVPSKQRTVLKVNVEEVIGTSDVTVLVLGYRNTSINWDQNSASWNSLSSQTSGLNILTPLNSGIVIDSINKTFINWATNSNLSIVGHITGKTSAKNQSRMIDVTDYYNQIVTAGGSSLTFVFYRPFRHPSYNASAGAIPADDLSKGSLIKFSGVGSLFPPELVHYWYPSVSG